MATLEAKSSRRAQALATLQQNKTDIAAKLGFDVTTPTLTNRDPEMAQIQQIEDVSGFLALVLERADSLTAPLIQKLAAAELERDAALSKVAELESPPSDELSVLNSLGDAVKNSLIEGGFETLEKVSRAADKDLTALPEIGPATVVKIRTAIKAHSDEAMAFLKAPAPTS